MSSAPLLAINHAVQELTSNKLHFVAARYPESTSHKPQNYISVKSSREDDEDEDEDISSGDTTEEEDTDRHLDGMKARKNAAKAGATAKLAHVKLRDESSDQGSSSSLSDSDSSDDNDSVGSNASSTMSSESFVSAESSPPAMSSTDHVALVTKPHSGAKRRVSFYDLNESPNDCGSLSNSRIIKSWSPEDRNPVGLQNHSVTCYMNSAMQALFHIPAMAHYLDDIFAGKKYKNEVSPTSVSNELATLHHRLITTNKRSGLYPSRMIRRINDINFLMSPMEQEDAHEYYMSLIGRLQEDSVPKGKKLNTSIIHDIFGGSLDQQVTCLNCKHVSSTTQEFYDVPVSFTKPIKQYGSALFRLEDSIRDFFAPEAINADKKRKNGYQCENCKKTTTAIKINFLDQAPEYLTIHLKRFKFDGSFSQKIKEAMLYPLELDLSQYSISNAPEGYQKDSRSSKTKGYDPIKYKLICIIAHSGRTASSGHYVAICRQPDGTWAEYDDELVSKIRSTKRLQQDNAYMLIYSRLKVKSITEASAPAPVSASKVSSASTSPVKSKKQPQPVSRKRDAESLAHDEIEGIFAKSKKAKKSD